MSNFFSTLLKFCENVSDFGLEEQGGASALCCLALTKKSAKKVPQHHKNPNVNKADKD